MLAIVAGRTSRSDDDPVELQNLGAIVARNRCWTDFSFRRLGERPLERA